MRPIVLAFALIAAGQQQAGPPVRTPVLVELFTSEGCSSCPPADALLSKLAHDQPVPGAEIVPLELHVTYWDDQGWKDPASLPAATARQRTYAERVFGTDNIYTPQAVIDGRTQAVGSDQGAIRKAVAKAAAQPHVHLGLDGSVEGGSVDASVTFGHDAASRDLLVAVVEDGVTSAVARGENSGRTLRHDAVVRAMTVTPVGAEVDSAHVRLSIDPRLPRERLRLVAALQGRGSGRVLGAAIMPLR